jgi:hypothetical protein
MVFISFINVFKQPPEEASRIHDISVFGKRLSWKSDNVVVFPFAFHNWKNIGRKKRKVKECKLKPV